MLSEIGINLSKESVCDLVLAISDDEVQAMSRVRADSNDLSVSYGTQHVVVGLENHAMTDFAVLQGFAIVGCNFDSIRSLERHTITCGRVKIVFWRKCVILFHNMK